jgi:hypothetical protein
VLKECHSLTFPLLALLVVYPFPPLNLQDTNITRYKHYKIQTFPFSLPSLLIIPVMVLESNGSGLTFDFLALLAVYPAEHARYKHDKIQTFQNINIAT